MTDWQGFVGSMVAIGVALLMVFWPHIKAYFDYDNEG